MRWIIVAGGVLVALAGLAALIGYLIPPTRITARSALLSAGPRRVWAVITAIDQFPQWRRHLRAVEPLPAVAARPAWKERVWHGVVRNQMDEVTPLRRLVVRVTDRALTYEGTWTYELAAEGTGTRLSITEHGEIEHPVCRVLARYVFGYTGNLDGYLSALERRLVLEQALPVDGRPQGA
jgi:uncharacterized protein YndB with AHSA1/START domain